MFYIFENFLPVPAKRPTQTRQTQILIRVFPVCYSDINFINASLAILFKNRKGSNQNSRKFTIAWEHPGKPVLDGVLDFLGTESNSFEDYKYFDRAHTDFNNLHLEWSTLFLVQVNFCEVFITQFQVFVNAVVDWEPFQIFKMVPGLV